MRRLTLDVVHSIGAESTPIAVPCDHGEYILYGEHLLAMREANKQQERDFVSVQRRIDHLEAQNRYLMKCAVNMELDRPIMIYVKDSLK